MRCRRGSSRLSRQDASTSGLHPRFWRCPKQLWMEIATLLARRFLLLDRNPIGVGISIMPDSGYLPRDLYIGLVSLDDKSVLLDLPQNDRLGELADHRELVTKISIQGFKIVR